MRLTASFAVMENNKNCLRCGEAISEDAHGNIKRCAPCSKKHKRESSRNKQKIIRELGNQGLKNYRIVEYLYSKHAQNGIAVTNIAKLVHFGFRFNVGITQIESSKTDPEYPNIIHVMDYELRYNAALKDKPVFIRKFQLK